MYRLYCTTYLITVFQCQSVCMCANMLIDIIHIRLCGIFMELHVSQVPYRAAQ